MAFSFLCNAFAYVASLFLWRCGGGGGVDSDAQTVVGQSSRSLDSSLHKRFRRRRALIVGINYTNVGEHLRLRGCVNDAQNMHQFVHDLAHEHLTEIEALQADETEHEGVDGHPFQCEIRVLTDDPVSLAALRDDAHPLIKTVIVDGQPTAKQLRDNLRWLVKDADEHTSLWFSYSGHGTYMTDLNGDERDGRDEALVPLDCETSGCITDDWLRANVVDVLPSGAKLTCLVDACHSATAFDLHVSLEDRSVYLNSLKRPLAQVRHYKRKEWKLVQQRSVDRKSAPCAADVLMISGCRDNQTSADAFEERNYTGAMTHAFLKHYRNCVDMEQLLQDMSVWLRIKKYSQRPVLSFGSIAAERATAWHMQMF